MDAPVFRLWISCDVASGTSGRLAGRTGAAAAASQNLQVLPKEWTNAQVLPVMRENCGGSGHRMRALPRLDGARRTGNDFRGRRGSRRRPEAASC